MIKGLRQANEYSHGYVHSYMPVYYHSVTEMHNPMQIKFRSNDCLGCM